MIIGLSTTMTAYAEEGYTYNYDWWEEVQYSPDAYEVVGVYTAAALGLDKKFNKPQGLFVSGNKVYIVDSGNNRIIELVREGAESFSVSRIIEEFNGPVEVNTFNYPTDIAVSEEGDLYIADQNNGRVLKLDKDLNYISEFVKPTDSTFDQSIDFLPSKIVIDTAGRVYCIAVNVNKGLIKYEPDGVFSGFVGATKVTYSWTDYIWKKFATKAQRAQMENFVPTEYNNIYMDYDGFIYTCTNNVTTNDVRSGSVDPIRRLNMMGNDILIRNGNFYVIGDVQMEAGGGYDGCSLIVDITAMNNDVYVALDKVRGRLFAYDDQGRLLYAFGGNGMMDGCFRQPIALDHMGHDLIVLDTLNCSITLFAPTSYGNDIYDAIEQFQNGQYNESGETWQKVMDQNGNYDLAYIGIGRALMGEKKYKEALDYFKLKWDVSNYSKAFKQYRKEWVEENIMLIIAIVFLVLCVPLIIGKIKRIKFQIDTADIFKYNLYDENKKEKK